MSKVHTEFLDVEKKIVAKKYDTALDMLHQFPRDCKHNYYYYYLIGIATFYSTEFKIDAAFSLFNKSLEFDHEAIEPRLYQAIIHLRNNQTEQSIKIWLDILERTSNNRYAKRAIYLMKRMDGTLLSLINVNPHKYTLLPVFTPSYLKRKRRIYTMIAISVSILIFTFGMFLFQKIRSLDAVHTIKNIRQKIIVEIDEHLVEGRNMDNNITSKDANITINKQENNDSETSTLESSIEFNAKSSLLISLSKNEIIDLMRDLDKNFVAYKDNMAQVIANTLLYSNASNAQKNRVRLIMKNIKKINFSSDVRWFSYEEMVDAPWKYNTVTVRWKGTVTQVQAIDADTGTVDATLNNSISTHVAQFLVGFYGKSKTLSGVVTVTLPKEIVLQDGDEVELLGALSYTNIPENMFTMQVKSFRYLLVE